MADRIPQSTIARARADAAWDSAFGEGPMQRHAYEGASRKGTMMGAWRPGLRSADSEWFLDRDPSIARTRDLVRNNPVANSAVNRRLNSAVGFRWDFSAKPNAAALGITEPEAEALGSAIETAWEQYAHGILFQADAERQLTFGQLLRMTAAHVIQDGEAFGLVEWAGEEGTKFKTRLRIVDPDRVSNPQGLPDSATLRRGVEKNTAQVPVAYHIREGHPFDVGAQPAMTWRRWSRYATADGRVQVVHAYDKTRAGLSRGVTKFASVLKSFRALQRYTDATLEAATINALFVAFVKSNAGVDAISESFSPDDYGEFGSERAAHYKDNPVELDGVQMPVLEPGDEVQMLTSARDTGGFDAFTRSILRLIAAALGVTYEELSMDFSQTNYSSARAALLIAWNETLALRGLLEAQVVWPFFAAWLEEAIDNGTIVLPAAAPAFWDAPDAYCEGHWRGPARGYIDPVKEIAAAAARIEAGISDLETECGDQGGDWRVRMRQRLIEELEERKLREAFGLPPAADGPGAVDQVTEVAKSPDHAESLDSKPGQPGKPGQAKAA